MTLRTLRASLEYPEDIAIIESQTVRCFLSAKPANGAQCPSGYVMNKSQTFADELCPHTECFSTLNLHHFSMANDAFEIAFPNAYKACTFYGERKPERTHKIIIEEKDRFEIQAGLTLVWKSIDWKRDIHWDHQKYVKMPIFGQYDVILGKVTLGLLKLPINVLKQELPKCWVKADRIYAEFTKKRLAL